MMAATEVICASCQAPLQPGDQFCEQCGARVSGEPAAGCRACGASADAIGEDGYCSVCGVREKPPAERTELDLGLAAAVSDQGRVHRRNEDAFHLEAPSETTLAIVVCDGISSASSGDVAAQTAASAAGAVLSAAALDPSAGARDATVEAIRVAREAVGQVPWTTRVDRAVPSCTLVSALWRGGEVTVGWVGDSRAYWIGADGVTQLTSDDSWVVEQLSEGQMSPEQAAHDPRLHSITNWVGPDAPDREPRVASLRPESPGRLLVCTDGLWNYAPSPQELAQLIAALPSGAAAAAVARALTDTALARGGRDNITVAVADIDPDTHGGQP
jgi:serine/threonine protein phosphatase PrpC